MDGWRRRPGASRALLLLLSGGLVAAVHAQFLLPLHAPDAAVPPRLLPPIPRAVEVVESPPPEPRPAEETSAAVPPPPAERPEPVAKPAPDAAAEAERRLAEEIGHIEKDPGAASLARAILGEDVESAPYLTFVMGDREKLEVPAVFGEEFLAIPQREDGLRFRIDPVRLTYEAVWDDESGGGVVHEKDYDRFRSLPKPLVELRKRIESDPRCNGGLYFFGTRLSEVEKRLVAARIDAELRKRHAGRAPSEVEMAKLRYRPAGKLYDIEVVELRLKDTGRE